jgi:hypothetical protein
VAGARPVVVVIMAWFGASAATAAASPVLAHPVAASAAAQITVRTVCDRIMSGTCGQWR